MTTDNDLHEALRRREPPDGFAQRAMARLNAGQPPVRRSRARAWVAMGVAASVLLAAGATQLVQHQRDANAERAAQQLTLALRITSNTLHEVRDKVDTTSNRVETLHDDQLPR